MLGIVTAVVIDLLPISEFYGGAIYFDGELAAEVLQTWRRWSHLLPESVNTSICLQQLTSLPGVPEPLAGRLTVAVRYTALGDVAEAQRLLQPMREVATPLIDGVGVLPYTAIGAVHADPVDPMPVHENHALLHELSGEAVNEILAACGPGSDSPQTIVELRLLGGALAREPQHRSAFCHRDAAYSLTTIGVLVPPAGDAVVGHAAALVDALACWSTGGQMPNVAASNEPGRQARCYSEGALHWLTALAKRHDPAAVMR